ncbi:hypothetical protein D9757_010288 [Collybiopsis confluens]|uniref:Uncharacterized protein n=1 Tax=Collybiopsis confluens TaxID=2823264 RepID=A0A8H5GU23_9AGAR|nr:hypothetical protein D9757_010288 [Collybiopsis confluens]
MSHSIEGSPNATSVLLKALEDAQNRVNKLEQEHKTTKLTLERERAENAVLKSRITQLESNLVVKKEEEDQRPLIILSKVEAHVEFLPGIPHITKRLVHGPRISPDLDMLSYLELVSPKEHWSDESFFFFPGSISIRRGGNQHYITCSPMTATIPGTQSRIQSPYDKIDGEAREYFTEVSGFAAYAGTYKCLRMTDFAPSGLALPSGLPIEPIIREASLSNEDDPKPGFPSHEQLRKLYESGELKVELTVFQCTGYNHKLASSLNHHEKTRKSQQANDQKNERKRSREDSVEVDGGDEESAERASSTSNLEESRKPSKKRSRKAVKKAAESDSN